MFNSRALLQLFPNEMYRMLAAIILTVGLYFPETLSAEPALERIKTNSMGCNYLLEGEIKKGQTEEVSQYLSQFRFVSPVICLDSPGGSLLEGITLAKLFRAKGIPTRVMAGTSCMSACAVAFMGGTQLGEGDGFSSPNRAIHAEGRLGFHAPSLKVSDGSYGKKIVDKAYRIAVQSVAEVLSAAAEIEMPLDAVETMLRTAPETFYDISTVGRSMEWNVDVYGLPTSAKINEPMWLTACLNFVGKHRGIGQFVPSDQQYVNIPEDGQKVYVTLNSGNVDTHYCKFERSQYLEQQGFLGVLGTVNVSDRDDRAVENYNFGQADFSPWHHSLATLRKDEIGAKLKPQVSKHFPSIPCSYFSDGQLVVNLCSVTETFVFNQIRNGDQARKEFQLVKWLEVSIPGRALVKLESDDFGDFPWNDYIWSSRGRIRCFGENYSAERICLPNGADLDLLNDANLNFFGQIVADCLNWAAAPFQVNGYDGVSIWSIDDAVASKACEAAMYFDDPARNATTALARVRIPG